MERKSRRRTADWHDTVSTEAISENAVVTYFEYVKNALRKLRHRHLVKCSANPVQFFPSMIPFLRRSRGSKNASGRRILRSFHLQPRRCRAASCLSAVAAMRFGLFVAVAAAYSLHSPSEFLHLLYKYTLYIFAEILNSEFCCTEVCILSISATAFH